MASSCRIGRPALLLDTGRSRLSFLLRYSFSRRTILSIRSWTNPVGLPLLILLLPGELLCLVCEAGFVQH